MSNPNVLLYCKTPWRTHGHPDPDPDDGGGRTKDPLPEMLLIELKKMKTQLMAMLLTDMGKTEMEKTKSKLWNPEAKTAVHDIVGGAVTHGKVGGVRERSVGIENEVEGTGESSAWIENEKDVGCGMAAMVVAVVFSGDDMGVADANISN